MIQSLMTISTTEQEYMAITTVAKEVQGLHDK